jgi:hypothetical protein
LDTVTVGRYLDQTAAALEYAHEHLVLHRSLTVDSLSLQRDGRILVSDFGVRRMLEQGRHDAQWYVLHNWNEACAPEQILGRPATPATDVYALAAVVYQLLTGQPLYSGATREDIAHQHLHAPIPSLRLYRQDIPEELDALLTRALAKDTAQRISQPGLFANAYHDIVSPQDSARVPFKMQPPQAVTARANAIPDRSTVAPFGPAELPQPSPRTAATISSSQRGTGQQSAQRTTAPRVMIAASVLVALLLATVFTVARLQSGAAQVPTGQVTFMDSTTPISGLSNALTIHATGLSAPDSGYTYRAWLINQQAEQVLPLGTLTKHGNGYTLSYRGATTPAGGAGSNLFATGNLLEVTLEHEQATLPVGKVVLAGTFPPQSFVHIGHLLVSFPTTPGKIGLLVGAEKETALLQTEVHALATAASNQDITAVDCETQNILDTIEGTEGPNYQPLSQPCLAQINGTTGDGFGLLGASDAQYHDLTGYLPSASEHAALAATQPDATANLRAHAHTLVNDITNVEQWVTTIQQDALLLQKTPFAQSLIQDMTTLASNAWNGASGKPGVVAAYIEGQDMATLTLVAKS